MAYKVLAVSALVLGFVAQPLMAQPAASSPSRADVKAEIPADRMKDAQVTGERMPPEKQWTPPASADNQPKTRAQVKRETAEAIAAEKGQKAPSKPPGKTFKQRRAEAAAAREARRPEAVEAAKNPDPTGGVYDPAKKVPAKP